MKLKFYDTCSSLLLQERLFTQDLFYISNITFLELENIKNSISKDDNMKYNARKLLHLLYKNQDKYKIISFDKEVFQDLCYQYPTLPINNDSKIISCVTQLHNDIIFCTSDLSCLMSAKNLLHIPTEYIESSPKDTYTGFVDVSYTLEELNKFYFELMGEKNPLNLINNQYAIIRNENNEVIDKFKFINNIYERIPYYCVNSLHFGEIKPRNVHQALVLDSFKSNDITLIGGPAGSGKTFLSLGFLFEQLEKGAIDRIVIFCNPVVAKNAAKLGYYPGTQLEKILSSQVGNVLSSKLGSITEVERLVANSELVIIPAGDCRGYEVPNNSGVYVMEAQNLDTVLLRMLLQRIGDNCKVIIDGDRQEQTDLDIYANDNGMQKMSQVFRGESIFGQVDLQSIERSKIAEIAERMK